MEKTIPNPDLIRYLLSSYYTNDIDHQEKDLVSSHWEHYSGLFDVKIDKNGYLISLSGQAFGSLKWGNLGHKILDQATILSHLLHLPHRKNLLRLRTIAAKVCDAMGLDLTFDAFRQVCSLELMQRNLPDDMRHKQMHIIMIGDGYGVLSALFKSIFPNSTVVMVDIGKTLLFQAYYCQKAHSECVHEFVTKVNDIDDVDFVYCPTEKFALLEKSKFDIVVSITSMQEMNVFTIARYFDFLRKCLRSNNLFYCCNRESKALVGGEVSEFLNYPWNNGDQYLVDEYCPWHQYFFSLSLAEKGPRLVGVRVPFVNFYDGRHLHRLAVMDTD